MRPRRSLWAEAGGVGAATNALRSARRGVRAAVMIELGVDVICMTRVLQIRCQDLRGLRRRPLSQNEALGRASSAEGSHWINRLILWLPSSPGWSR